MPTYKMTSANVDEVNQSKANRRGMKRVGDVHTLMLTENVLVRVFVTLSYLFSLIYNYHRSQYSTTNSSLLYILKKLKVSAKPKNFVLIDENMF